MLNRILRPALVGMCLCIAVIGTQAATLTVNTTADGGLGSLRQAIIDATSNAEANTVSFNIPTSDPGFNAVNNRFTITLASALPPIPLAPFSMSNAQPQALTVTGNNTFRIFTFVDSAVVTIDNITISNGSSNAAAGKATGKRRQLGSIDLTAGYGGGIYMGNSSTLDLINSVITGNAASIDGGGIYMSDSTTAHVVNSTISNNTAPYGGGAIFIHDSGTLNIDSSTVNANSASVGGAFYNGTSATINANSSTIDGNSATGNGGGIYNTATITLTNNTVTGNTALRGGGIYNAFTATLENNLVALNTATNAGNDLFGGGGLGGNAFTGSYNLIGNIDDSVGLESAPNRSGTTQNPLDPMIGPLQDNGGPTFTRILLAGSPAIDAGSSPTLVLDQRGDARPVGDGPDIGAVEVQGPAASLVSISGHLFSPDGRGLRNAVVFLTDAAGNTRTTVTSAFGDYRFDNVQTGEIYTIGGVSKRYRFLSMALTVNATLSGVDMTGEE